MGRRINDDVNGLKLDKFRNSRFEPDDERQYSAKYGGVSKKTSNTLGGLTAENRGRRSADSLRSRWDGSPFEDGQMDNWGRRDSRWDNYYNKAYDRGNRNYGGAQLDHEGSHVGKGPRGYKRSDGSILEDVCRTLQLSPDVDASDIEVSVKEGIVYLNGNVQDRGSKRMAELEIENISGVTDVQNLLGFRRSNEDLH
jgi:osmotically-inducible protein OsmY